MSVCFAFEAGVDEGDEGTLSGFGRTRRTAARGVNNWRWPVSQFMVVVVSVVVVTVVVAVFVVVVVVVVVTVVIVVGKVCS